VLAVLLIIIISSFLLGFSFYRGPPTGIWTNKELGITIDFDNRISLPIDQPAAYRGIIIIDGEAKEIACRVYGFGGEADFYFIEEINNPPHERDFIYRGSFSNAIRNRMIFREKKWYVFVRQEPLEISINKPVLIISTGIIISAVLLFACKKYRGSIRGIWISKELDTTVNFNDRVSLKQGRAYKGTIVIDGKISEIICTTGSDGKTGFCFIEEINKPPHERDFIYTGVFGNFIAENKLVFKITGSRTWYTFVKL